MIFDYAIVGAGISGASSAFLLAESASVALIEAESQPGYHATGRSAALFTPNYGGDLVRRINRCSQPFFTNPPTGFGRLLTARGALTVAGPGLEDELAPLLALSSPEAEVRALSAARALALAPLLRPDRVAAAVYEPGVADIDVSGLHQSFLRGFKERGGTALYDRRIEGLERKGGRWILASGGQRIEAACLIDAAGAWADSLGVLAGAAEIGLVPKRRTAIVVEAPGTCALAGHPLVDAVDAASYFKPEAGRIMASLGDETPVAPQDVQPEELDIALAADWLERTSVLRVRRILQSWAGLRSFVADQAPVVGFDGKVEDFFWLAGQGGFGIMMAPTLARAAAALLAGQDMPSDLRDRGLEADDLSPARLAAA
ncbi:MAG: FAD-binding oxidoreductase [Rhodospirillales bacterium]